MHSEQTTVPVCIFCHTDSSASVSREHIVPEALENDSLVLPPGTVCDTCNNYLGRKVEGPIVNSAPMLALRHMQGIGNKRGRVPTMDLVLENGVRAQMQLEHWSGQRTIGLAEPDTRLTHFEARVSTPKAGYAAAPDSAVASRDLARFTAKSGFEYLALQNLRHNGSLTHFNQAPELDLCRRFVRYGQGPASWDVSIGRLYEPDTQFEIDEPGDQRVWELDFLVVEHRHVVFAMSLFGLEMSVCLTDPSLEPYRLWRRATGFASLLHPATR